MFVIDTVAELRARLFCLFYVSPLGIASAPYTKVGGNAAND
jgi:hypothetical protein